MLKKSFQRQLTSSIGEGVRGWRHVSFQHPPILDAWPLGSQHLPHLFWKSGCSPVGGEDCWCTRNDPPSSPQKDQVYSSVVKEREGDFQIIPLSYLLEKIRKFPNTSVSDWDMHMPSLQSTSGSFSDNSLLCPRKVPRNGFKTPNVSSECLLTQNVVFTTLSAWSGQWQKSGVSLPLFTMPNKSAQGGNL